MTIVYCNATGRSGLRFLYTRASLLHGDHIIAVQADGMNKIFLLPFKAARFLAGEQWALPASFIEQACDLHSQPVTSRNWSIGPASRADKPVIDDRLPQLLDAVAAGHLVTYVQYRSARGVFVPASVIAHLATGGRGVPAEFDQHLRSRMMELVDVERSIFEWTNATPLQRLRRSLKQPDAKAMAFAPPG